MAVWQALTAAGWSDLWYLDESGFAPTLPTGYTWARAGTRALVWDEPPAGRRLNVLGAVAPFGPVARLAWTVPAGKLDSAALLAFIRHDIAGLPATAGTRRDRPCVVVLDNASAHVSKLVKAARPALEAANVWLYYLPPYSPELNAVERLFRTIKHHELPERTYPTLDGLTAAVEAAFTRQEAKLLHQHQSQLRPAA